MPLGVTLCHPAVMTFLPLPHAAEAGTRFSDTKVWWVDHWWWLHPGIVYPLKRVTYPIHNQAVSWLAVEPTTMSHESGILTTTPPSHPCLCAGRLWYGQWCIAKDRGGYTSNEEQATEGGEDQAAEGGEGKGKGNEEWVTLQISTGFTSWQRYRTASSSGRQPNFAALNRGRHLCSAGRPSRWALAHILVVLLLSNLYIQIESVCPSVSATVSTQSAIAATF